MYQGFGRAAVWSGIVVAMAWGQQARADVTIGMNIEGNNDWGTQGIWTDVSKMLRSWGMPNQPWVTNPSLTYTADGYPLQSAGAITYLNDYPDGVYKLTYQGNATVTAGGMGRISNVVHSGDTTTADITITHAWSDILDLEVSNVDAANPLSNLSLLAPGTRPGQVFTDAFTRRLAPFDTLRFMDTGGTNGNTLQTWSQRPTPSTSIQTSGNGIALEYMVAMANQAGANPWFNVPAMADDDYVRNMAKLVHEQLTPGRTVYVEYSNEVWNGSFPQYSQVLADAKANTALTATDDFGRVGQQDAVRTRQIGEIFKQEFGADAGQVKVVLGGQAAWTYFMSQGLSYLQGVYGPGKTGIDAVAIAPYVNINESTDVAGLTLDGLFAALNRELDTTVTNWIKSSSALAQQYGLPMLAYEGGQGLVGWNSIAGGIINQDLKTQANHDPRMGELLTKLAAIWEENGGGLFDEYSFVGRDSQYGFWGALQDITDPGSPKWDALMRLTQPMGDADLNGELDSADFAILAAHLGESGMWWEQGDFNGDGMVNSDDIALFDRSLAERGLYRVGYAVVPEPATAGMGAAAVIGLLLGRRRRR